MDPTQELQGKVESLSRLIQTRLDKGDENLKGINVEIDGVKAEVSTLAKVIADTEKRFERAAYGGIGLGGVSVMNHLKEVIPDRMRASVDLAARAGYKDPYKAAAQAAWLKIAAKLSEPAKFGIGSPGPYLEEMEKLSAALGDDIEVKADLQTSPDAQGGFLVPTVTEAEVMRKIEDAAVVRGQARKLTMTAKTHEIPKLDANIAVAWENEAAAIGASEPTFLQLTLTANRQSVRSVLSMEIIQDSAIGILDFVFTLMAEQAGQEEDVQALEGTGSPFTGLSNEATVNELIQDDGAGSDLNGGLPTYKFLVKTKWNAGEASTRARAAWIMHPFIAGNVEGIVDDQSRPVWSNPTAGSTALFGQGANQAVGLLLGFPVFTTTRILVNRVRGTLSNASQIYYGPYGHGMIYGDRLGMTFGVSEHVLWNNAQLVARMIKRTAILVAQGSEFTRLIAVDAR